MKIMNFGGLRLSALTFFLLAFVSLGSLSAQATANSSKKDPFKKPVVRNEDSSNTFGDIDLCLTLHTPSVSIDLSTLNIINPITSVTLNLYNSAGVAYSETIYLNNATTSLSSIITFSNLGSMANSGTVLLVVNTETEFGEEMHQYTGTYSYCE